MAFRNDGHTTFLMWLSVCALFLICPQPAEVDAHPHRLRVTRSCGNQVSTLILGACNKNHKRSPLLVNFIFLQYYSNSTSSGTFSPSHDALIIQDALKPIDLLNPLFSPWVLEHEETRDFEDQRGDNEVRGGDSSYRSGRTPASYFLSIMEKCCSISGCTEADFISHCY